jgi:glycosyltransferase involved in cell wall biosynthesis
MRLAINAVSAQMGGAVTYLRNVLPVLARTVASRDKGRILLWARPELASGLNAPGIEVRSPGAAADALGAVGIGRRIWFDQWELPRRLRREHVDALFSSANIGSLRSPVPQLLLVRNPIFFEPILLDRLGSLAMRVRYAAERRLIIASIRASQVVFFPTRAMLDMVAAYAGGPPSNWRVAPYGARHDLFHPVPGAAKASKPVSLLHVSHYCDQKNIGTLLAAVQRLENRAPGRYHLRLTAGLSDLRPGPRLPSLAVDQERYLRLERCGAVLDWGSRSYASLPDLYRSADLFVFPSYSESFGHPLVEAMASGLPIVAADVAVNREMCADAAIYFPAFDAVACAEAIERVTKDGALAAQLRQQGLQRAAQFTWERHVEVLWSAIGEMLAW